ncbi:hypothetical protein, partial [Paenibacillus sp. FSL M7-0831]|uniref:hypothetical protein n=1 Tax=Paenibacillus sp. FSL M7-0831 TaxID=2975314 RepID=UPI0030F76866
MENNDGAGIGQGARLLARRIAYWRKARRDRRTGRTGCQWRRATVPGARARRRGGSALARA